MLKEAAQIDGRAIMRMTGAIHMFDHRIARELTLTGDSEKSAWWVAHRLPES